MNDRIVTVNGSSVAIDAGRANETLQELIRSEATLTGTAGACGHGVCGACTVLLDGRPVRSCLTLSATVAGRSVVTVEGLELVDARAAALLRNEFIEQNAFQCGYCTSGMLTLGLWWLTAADAERAASPEVADVLDGNLCRCTGYEGLRRALTKVRDELSGAAVEA